MLYRRYQRLSGEIVSPWNTRHVAQLRATTAASLEARINRGPRLPPHFISPTESKPFQASIATEISERRRYFATAAALSSSLTDRQSQTIRGREDGRRVHTLEGPRAFDNSEGTRDTLSPENAFGGDSAAVSDGCRQIAYMHATDAGLDSPTDHQWGRATSEMRWLVNAAKKVVNMEVNMDGYNLIEKGKRVDDMVAKLVSEHVDDAKPLAYILKYIPFGSLNILTRSPVLIPRPETEEWVLHLSKRLSSPDNHRILDIGTGTGCISLLLANEDRRRRVVSADIAPAALELAQDNARALKLTRQVSVIAANLFDGQRFALAVQGKLAQVLELRKGSDPRFDLIVSNPPYIPEHEWAQLGPEVKSWEDKGALVGDDLTAEDLQTGSGKTSSRDGLAFYRQIASMLPTLLRGPGDQQDRNPRLVLEVGEGQAEAVKALVEEVAVEGGWERVEIWKDFRDVQRVVVAR